MASSLAWRCGPGLRRECSAMARSLCVVCPCALRAQELELLRFRTLGGTARTLQQAVRQLPALTALTVSCLPIFSLEPRNPAGPAAHVWGSVFDGLTVLKVRH